MRRLREQRPVQSEFRLLINPSIRLRLVHGDLSEWLDFLLMRIAIYFNHRFAGDMELHDFKFRDRNGALLIFSVVFTDSWAQISSVSVGD